MDKRKIPCKFTNLHDEPNSNLYKVTIRVMSDGQNLNGSSFDLSSMINAEESIKNTAILAFLVKDEDGNLIDFDGHNMETDLVEGTDGYELKTTYLEVPVGVIPESCNPRYENVNGRNYFVVDGYVWKTYGNGTHKLIENEDEFSVSMEIKVDEGTYCSEDEVYQIKRYKYEGVTILGKNVPPAIEGSRITKYSSSLTENKVMLEKIYKEIYKIEESEVQSVDDIKETVTEDFEVENKKVADDDSAVIEKEEPPVTPVEPPTGDSGETVVADAQADTTQDFKEKKKNDEKDEEEEDKDKEEKTKKKDDVEDDEEDKKKRKKCSAEDFSLECFSVFFEEIPSTLDEVCSALVEKFNVLNAELNNLREFKQNYDNALLEDEINSMISEFSFNEEEVKELKEKAMNKEISVKEFKKELFALEGMKLHANKKEFSKEKEEKIVTKINVTSELENHEPYGGLFAKYNK